MSNQATNISATTSESDTITQSTQVQKTESSISKSSKAIIVCLVIAAGGFLYGYDIGSTGGLFEMPQYVRAVGDFSKETQTWVIPSWRSGLIMGCATFGGLFGSLGFGKVADSFGRRWGLIACSVLISLAAVIHATCRNFWPVVLVARFMTGASMGGFSTICPMYITEASPNKHRALLISCFQLLLTFGILFAQFINLVSSLVKSIGQFMTPILAIMIFSVPVAIGALFYLPESAKYLVATGNTEKAARSLAQLMDADEHSIEVQDELQMIEKSVKADREIGAATWGELFKFQDRIFYRVILALCVMALQQLTGVNYFFFYGTSLFKQVSTMSPFVTPLILGGVNVIGTIACLPIIVKYPRRVVLMSGSFVMFISLILFTCLGSFSLYSGPNGTVSMLVGPTMIVLACIFILGFASTWAPMSFLVVSEMFPQRFRSKAFSLAVAFSWLINTLITIISPIATAVIGYNFGFVFSFFALLSILVVYFFVFETQGHSLDDVDNMFKSGISARNSPSWVPSKEADMTEMV